jgi:hypothetical protein
VHLDTVQANLKVAGMLGTASLGLLFYERACRLMVYIELVANLPITEPLQRLLIRFHFQLATLSGCQSSSHSITPFSLESSRKAIFAANKKITCSLDEGSLRIFDTSSLASILLLIHVAVREGVHTWELHRPGVSRKGYMQAMNKEGRRFEPCQACSVRNNCASSVLFILALLEGREGIDGLD